MTHARSTRLSILPRLALLAALIACATGLSIWLTWNFWVGLGWPLPATVATVFLLEGSLAWILDMAASWMTRGRWRRGLAVALLAIVALPLVWIMAGGSFANSASGLVVASHQEAQAAAEQLRAADPRIPALELEREQLQRQRARLEQNAADERARGYYRNERAALRELGALDEREAQITMEISALRGLNVEPPTVAPHFAALAGALDVAPVDLVAWWSLGFAGLLEWLRLALLLGWHLSRTRTETAADRIETTETGDHDQPMSGRVGGDDDPPPPGGRLAKEDVIPASSQDAPRVSAAWTPVLIDRYDRVLQALDQLPEELSYKAISRVIGVKTRGHISMILGRLVDEGYAERTDEGVILKPAHRRPLPLQTAALELAE